MSSRIHTCASVAALLGSLATFGIGSASATVIGCGPQTQQDATSEVLSNTVGPSAGLYSYNFTVCNTSGGYNAQTGETVQGRAIYDWEIPWDPTVNINQSSITSPEGWNFVIETIGQSNSSTGWDGLAQWQIANNPNDPLNMYGAFPAFRNHQFVLHWFTCQEANSSSNNFEGCRTILPGDSLSEFGFVADIPPTAGPYQASWFDIPPRAGDPDLPGAGIAFRTNQIPEPTGLALFALGLGAMMAGRRRKSGQ